ncbi:MAG: hypothetical protein M9953_08905 [Thermomicrobiales bacterium]|nr:hypothetical protein [Thermomicrobiales bacterium]MCO5219142.1 hypothetical protein [Thermomicrobiales bacterium]MCO5225442.1 hypothetical protein [Thermomicrobiales bacterium]MCO5228984.1 hypothetical protein [Thermomicrobiales bacterium]
MVKLLWNWAAKIPAATTAMMGGRNYRYQGIVPFWNDTNAGMNGVSEHMVNYSRQDPSRYSG